MSDKPIILNRGIWHSLTGFSIQIIISALFIWLKQIYPNDLIQHVFWTSIAGNVIWLHLLLSYLLLWQEARYHFCLDNNEAETDTAISDGNKINRIRFFHRAYQRFMVPILELGIAALLIQSTLTGFQLISSKIADLPENNFLLITLFSVFAFVLIVFSVYLNALIKVKLWQLLKIGRNYVNLMIVMFCGLLTATCGNHFGLHRFSTIIDWGFTAINTLLAAEIMFSLLMRWFAPRRSEIPPRPAFEFYLLDALFQPFRIGETLADLLEGVFGFDILQTSLGKVIRSVIMPAVFLTVVVLSGLSSLVIVKPYEQAIIINMGRLNRQPVHSGLHFKLPWPLASVRHYNVSQIRSMHVGSHKSYQTGRSVYREGVSILWTNMHGLTVDELLICSSPQNRANITVHSGKENISEFRKVPSVSLAAADIHVQYIIEDLMSYVCSSVMPEVFLRNIAETCASRLIYHYDIDTLFCEARLSLAEKIRRSIQDTCDTGNLGVKIVHVAITGVHPPVEVAGAFEETVAAMQERETEIQYARQQAIRSQVETTGSIEAFKRLSALADSVDLGHGEDVATHERLLHECGGEVSKILAESKSYRFSRESYERGKTERFGGQLHAYTASPQNYLYDQYLAILEKSLAKNKKVVLLENNDNTIIRMGLGQSLGLNAIPEEMGF